MTTLHSLDIATRSAQSSVPTNWRVPTPSAEQNLLWALGAESPETASIILHPRECNRSSQRLLCFFFFSPPQRPVSWKGGTDICPKVPLYRSHSPIWRSIPPAIQGRVTAVPFNEAKDPVTFVVTDIKEFSARAAERSHDTGLMTGWRHCGFTRF